MNTEKYFSRNAAIKLQAMLAASFIALTGSIAYSKQVPLKNVYVSSENVELIFSPGEKFSMKVNLCGGYGVMTGTYIVYPSGHAIKCTVTGYDFKGFAANYVKEFDFEENSDFGKLIYRGEQIGCAPSPISLFEATETGDEASRAPKDLPSRLEGTWCAAGTTYGYCISFNTRGGGAEKKMKMDDTTVWSGSGTFIIKNKTIIINLTNTASNTPGRETYTIVSLSASELKLRSAASYYKDIDSKDITFTRKK